jgi:deazaflavin-dependent oxidoreductase (nitroreductase family)
MIGLTRVGFAPKGTYVLTVPGRMTGRPRSTPVTAVEDDGRWLVAPYGAVGWVRNVRAAREVELARAGRRERFGVDEVGPDQAAPILRRYLRQVAVVRPYFAVGPDAPLDRFAAEAAGHPVFRLTPVGRTARSS